MREDNIGPPYPPQRHARTSPGLYRIRITYLSVSRVLYAYSSSPIPFRTAHKKYREYEACHTCGLTSSYIHQSVHHCKDFSDEWQDLDDLLEAAVDGVGNSASNLAFNGGASVGGEPKVEAKLSEIDALLKTEAATGALGGSSSTTEGSAASRAEEAGVKINKATEAFLGTACGEWQEGKHPLRREELGQEEERLLQMASDVFPAAVPLTRCLIFLLTLDL